LSCRGPWRGAVWGRGRRSKLYIINLAPSEREVRRTIRRVEVDQEEGKVDMKEKDRKRLQEMYSRYAGERTDGGKDFTLEDHLHQARLFRRQFGEEKGPVCMLLALRVPREYVEALFAATAD